SKLTISNERTLGAGATFEWATEHLTIVLGANTTIHLADTITFEAGNGIFDITGQKELATVTKTLGGSFGVAAAPVISAVTATNGGGTAAVEAGDTIQLVFNSAPARRSSDRSKLTISNGRTVGTGATFEWTLERLTIV